MAGGTIHMQETTCKRSSVNVSVVFADSEIFFAKFITIQNRDTEGSSIAGCGRVSQGWSWEIMRRGSERIYCTMARLRASCSQKAVARCCMSGALVLTSSCIQYRKCPQTTVLLKTCIFCPGVMESICISSSYPQCARTCTVRSDATI